MTKKPVDAINLTTAALIAYDVSARSASRRHRRRHRRRTSPPATDFPLPLFALIVSRGAPGFPPSRDETA